MPAVSDRLFVGMQDATPQRRRIAGAARGVARTARHRPLRPVPAPCGDRASRCSTTGATRPGDPRARATRASSLRRHHRPRPRRPGGAPEALRRYDLDTVMFPVNARMWATRLPARRRGAARALRRARSRRDGDQGGRRSSVGRAPADGVGVVRAVRRARAASTACGSRCRSRACTRSARRATPPCCARPGRRRGATAGRCRPQKTTQSTMDGGRSQRSSSSRWSRRRCA